MSSDEKTRLRLLPLWVGLIVFVIVQSLAAILAFYIDRTARGSEQLRFEASVQRKLDTISAGLDVYLTLLRSLAAYVSATGNYQIEDLYNFGRRLNIRTNYPGIQGIGLTIRVNPEDKESFEGTMRQQGWRDFSIWPEHIREEYHSIVFLYPPDERNLAAIGYDMYSEPARRRAMATARDTGSRAASGKVTLVQEITEEKQPGFLIYLPIYEGGIVPASIEERRQRLIGFSYSPFRANDLFNRMFRQSESAEEIDFIVFDNGTLEQENILHDSRQFSSGDVYSPRHQLLRSFEIAGREWNILLLSRPAFHELAPYNPFWWILMGGFVLGLLSSAVAGMRIRNQQAIMQESHKLYEQKEWLSVTLSSIGDAVIATNRKGEVIFLNRIAENLTGWSSSEAIGQHLDSVFKVFDRLSNKRVVFNSTDFGQSIVIPEDADLLSKNGERVPIEDSFAPIRSEQGNVEGVVIVFHDVTSKRKRNLTESIEYEAAKEFNDPLDVTESIKALIKVICSRLEWETGAFWMLSDSHYELKCFVSLKENSIDPHALSRPLSFELAKKNGERSQLEHSFPVWKTARAIDGFETLKEAPAGTIVAFPVAARGQILGLIELTSSAEKEKDDHVINSFISIGRQAGQVIERKNWENALLESESRFKKLANTAPILIRTSGEDKLCNWFNETWLRFTGRTVEQELGNGWIDGIHPDDKERAVKIYSLSFDNRREFKMEYRLRRRDGHYRWMIDHGIPLYGIEGKFSGYIGSCTDVTELRGEEEERKRRLAREQELRREAQVANRMKDEFLATLSHELRTPLNAVQGWAQLIRRKPGDYEHLQRGLDIIERNARMQGQIIEDLLDMNRIMSGRIRLDVENFELDAVINDSLETIRPAADAKGITVLKKDLPPALRVRADRQRLQQILWNLLSNAVKFTPRGGEVRVEVRLHDTGYELIVSDTGEGIKKEFLESIFDRFRQADATTSRRHGGLGLGLAIVKHLVEIHGGTITAKSDGPDTGASFTVWLPIPEAREGEETSGGYPPPALRSRDFGEDDVRLEGISVLVVDDQSDARELVKEILSESGANVSTASSADEAIERLPQFKPHVIVSDIGMPIKDGYEFLRMVRSLPPEKGGEVPALALTAFARAEDRIAALKSGYQMHLAKPTEPERLKRAIASLVASQ